MEVHSDCDSVRERTPAEIHPAHRVIADQLDKTTERTAESGHQEVWGSPGARQRFLHSLTVPKQWEYLAEQPKLLRHVNWVSIMLDVALVGVVLVYGWRLVGMPWVQIVPVFLYILMGTAFAILYYTQGPATQLNYLGMIEGALQLYAQGWPLFQRVGQVCHLCHIPSISVVHHTAQVL
jgi:hypothetical protein